MRHLLLFTFIHFCGILFCQNWAIVAPDDIYHYKPQDSTYISHTIRVDSVKVVGTDTVSYLNPVVYIDSHPNYMIASNKWAGIFGQKIVKKANGDLDLIYDEFDGDPIIVTLRPGAPVGSSWYSTWFVQAKLLAEEERLIMGELDSVKIFQIETSNIWVLSKNHGIVSLRAFFWDENLDLAGIETRSLGQKPYQFEDYFNFNNGDIFEWQLDNTSAGSITTQVYQWKILDKEMSPDTFRYYIERRLKGNWNTGTDSGIYYQTDSTWVNHFKSNYPQLAVYNRGSLPIPHPGLADKSTYISSFEEGIRVGTKLSIQPLPDQCSVFPTDSFYNSFYISDIGVCCSFNTEIGCEEREYYEEYRRGLGRVEYLWSLMDNRLHERLTGAILQGDTVWGIISPDSFFTNTASLERPQPLSIVPNPAGDHIQFPGIPFTGEGVVRIIDAGGRILLDREMAIAPAEKVDVSHLPKGLYFVQLIYKNQIWIGRFQKVK